MFSKDKLQHLVDERGLNPYKLSKLSRINHTTLYRALNGSNKDIRFSTVCLLADVFGVELDYFREDKEK